MPFNALVTRSGAQSLMPEDVTREIIQGTPQSSAVMRLARRLPNMTRAQQRMPVLSGLVTAYFVDGDTGLKQASNAAWANKYLNAGELAVIIPIPQSVLDDTDYDLWGEIKPRAIEAIGKAFDQAVFYGTNAPTDWPTALVPGALAASQSISYAAPPAPMVDLYDMILGEGGVNALVEADGFMVTGHVGAMIMKSRLRGLRDANGQPIFLQGMTEATTNYILDGAPVIFPINGSVDAAQSLLISGQWDQLVYSIRQDITYTVLTEAVIQGPDGAIIYNLPQQDMVALRVVIRLAWQLPNPISALAPTEATRYPFAILRP